MEENVLTAEQRVERGTRRVRRHRAAGRLPANIYGLGGENLLVSLDAKVFAKFLSEGHKMATIQIGDRVEHGVIKEVQMDPLGTTLMHVDFERIRQDQAIEVDVSVELVGVPKGVASGGILSFSVQDLLVSGLPVDLPERYRINVENLEVGHSIRLKDLTPPPNCRFVGDAETVIVGVLAKKEEVAPPPAVTEQPAQPEVIGRKKEEEEGEKKTEES